MINEFDGISKFRNHYPKYKGLDFLYDSENHIIPSNELFKKPQNEQINQNPLLTFIKAFELTFDDFV